MNISKTKNPKNLLLAKLFSNELKKIQNEIDTSSSEKEILVNTMRLKKLTSSLKVIINTNIHIRKGIDIKHIPGIGNGTIQRIDKILDDIKKGNIYVEKKNNSIVDSLEKIQGIGRKKAIELKKNGITSVEDLIEKHKQGKIELSEQIILGLKYRNLKPLKRKTIDLINDLLERKKILFPNLLATICGSYRRGENKSGDVDILISSKKNYLRQFVNSFMKDSSIDGILVDTISFGDVKYSGYFEVNKKKGRIDIRYIPLSSYYSALLYFTGPAEFNIKIRKHAKKLGFKLSEYGLFNLKKKVSIKINSEKDIFERLGLKYLAPEQR